MGTTGDGMTGLLKVGCVINIQEKLLTYNSGVPFLWEPELFSMEDL